MGRPISGGTTKTVRRLDAAHDAARSAAWKRWWDRLLSGDARQEASGGMEAHIAEAQAIEA